MNPYTSQSNNHTSWPGIHNTHYDDFTDMLDNTDLDIKHTNQYLAAVTTMLPWKWKCNRTSIWEKKVLHINNRNENRHNHLYIRRVEMFLKTLKAHVVVRYFGWWGNNTNRYIWISNFKPMHVYHSSTIEDCDYC